MSEPILEQIQPSVPLAAMPDRYIMIALRGIVVMPFMTLAFDVARDKSLEALNKVVERNESIFLVPQKHAQLATPGPKDICRVGCVCRVKSVMKLPNDTARVTVEGLHRAQIKTYVAVNPFFEVETQDFVDIESDPVEIEAYRRKIKHVYEEFARYETKIPPDVASLLSVDEPDKFCYMIAQFVLPKESARQELIALNSLAKRMETIYLALNAEVEILRIEKKIAAKVRKSMEQSQKEYFLREQAKAIHEELGDGEEDLNDYLKKAESLKLPPEPMDKVRREVARLGRMNGTSPEAGVSRTYIEWLLDVPWSKLTKDNDNLVAAREILDEDHYGLEKVKERILEYLAVLHLTKKIKGPILCFVGPPGVGKTSIVRSIARALDRKFVSMSLGGVRDEAEIRGHRRTYIGAIPGSIIYHMKQAGTVNPVFLLDEIDKMASDYRGDPASAMLEVLDPEQNFQYRDHYLEVPYDLSSVLFVTTANSLDTVPAPLLDRMEVIELSGYTETEKVEIGKRYLIDKQRTNNGLTKVNVEMNEAAIRHVVNSYTRESGVRNLERNIGGICRKIAREIVEGSDQKKFEVGIEEVEKYLGIPKFTERELGESDEIGAATGLAWTSVGGTTMTLEVALMDGGKGDIILTGKLGDVMKESARTAISVVHGAAHEFGIDAQAFAHTDIHLHVPEGATPKDGPSAGITIATAVLSAFTKRLVDRSVAMTGEITLRGNVLAIGGLKEKMLAAHRFGIKKLIIPKDNGKDLAEIPQEIVKSFEITLASNIREVWNVALKEPV